VSCEQYLGNTHRACSSANLKSACACCLALDCQIRGDAEPCRYDVLIDGESKKSGSLFEDFEPPFNPPEEIDDPEETKPEDWVDTAK
jgi:Calreticulin family